MDLSLSKMAELDGLSVYVSKVCGGREYRK